MNAESSESYRKPDAQNRAEQAFAEMFEAPPEQLGSAPGRVNLIGEHTDYNDGFVMPLAIEQRAYVVGRINHSQRCRVVAADLDSEQSTFMNDDSLAPGTTAWANYVKGVVAMFKRQGQPVPSFDAAIASDVPLGSGLSSSAALEVATASFIEALTQIRIESKHKALWCQQAEHEFAGVPCGIMDQMISALGKQGQALLLDCRSLEERYVAMNDPSIALVVCNSNVEHNLGMSEYPVRRKQCEQAVEVLHQENAPIKALRDATMADLESVRASMGPVIYRRARHVIGEDERTTLAADALEAGDYDKAGRLMHESHVSLRDDYEVSCKELDILVDLAMNFAGGGVYGSRMTGGGFGGCTVTLCKAARAEALIEHMNQAYTERTGISPMAFVTRPAAGAASKQLK